MPPTELRDEIAQRRSRFEDILAQHADAAVIATPENFYYFTGYRSPSWALQARPMFLVLRPGRPAAAIVNAAEVERIEETGVEVEAHGYHDPTPVAHDGFAMLDFAPAALGRLSEVLRPLGRTIGFELGSQMIARIPPTALSELRNRRGLIAVDLTASIWKMRTRKSPREVEQIRRAADALAATYARFEQDAQPGMTETDLDRLFRDSATGTGAIGYLIVIAGTDSSVLGPPTERTWQSGQLLLVDAGITVDGYWSDFSRLYVADEPSDPQLGAYQRLVQMLDRGRSQLAPGASCKALAAALSEQLDERASDSFGRVGHGVGLDLTEPPSLHPQDATELTPGMTLCLEPNFSMTEVGMLVAEEMIHVTSTGGELLSPPFPRELPIISR